MTESKRFIFLIVAISFAGLVYMLAPILSPFLTGALLAYLFDPLADKLESFKLSRTLSVVIVFVLMSSLVILLFLLLIPNLGNQIQILLESTPKLIDLVETSLIPWMQTKFNLDFSQFNLSYFKKFLVKDIGKASDVMAQIISSITTSGMALLAWTANLVLVPVVTFYLLRDWDIMVAKIKLLLPRNIEPKVSVLTSECDEVLAAFMKGQLMVMLGLGTIYAIGLWIIGLELALLIGLIAGLASIVPYMGFIIGIIVAGVAAFMQFNDVMVLGYVGIVFAIGQALEGMVLTPLLVGDRIGLHPVAVIFAIMAGGQLFGFVGILLALPVAAIIMVLLRRLNEGYKGSKFYSSERDIEVDEVELDSGEVKTNDC